ncbi:unnamed protein product, partial [Musa acuminata subsp. burmannicoides]
MLQCCYYNKGGSCNIEGRCSRGGSCSRGAAEEEAAAKEVGGSYSEEERWGNAGKHS